MIRYLLLIVSRGGYDMDGHEGAQPLICCPDRCDAGVHCGLTDQYSRFRLLLNHVQISIGCRRHMLIYDTTFTFKRSMCLCVSV